MIGSLNGTVELRDDPYLLINVSGVGYKVLAATDVLSKINGMGEAIKLFTYTHVRDDALELYGFSTRDDLKLFESLLSVSGIGPKTAMSVFAIGTSDEIKSAIAQSNVSFFTSVPRLGKKNAQKIIIELKGKIGSIKELDLTGDELKDHEQVIEVLKTFGFSGREATEATRSIKGQGETTEEKVRLALKYLGK